MQVIPVLTSFGVYVGMCYGLSGMRRFFLGKTEEVAAKNVIQPQGHVADESVCIALSVANLLLGAVALTYLSEKGLFNVVSGGHVWSELAKLACMLFLSDTSFYWSHRLLHVPWVYTRYHRLHHQHVSPISWTALKGVGCGGLHVFFILTELKCPSQDSFIQV